MGKMDERILVVDRDVIFNNEDLTFHGLSTDVLINTHVVSKFEKCKEVRRGDAEENTDWKQPIPYAIIRRGDEIFTYRRLKGSGETRLHDRLSIGVGGHMNAVEGCEEWSQVFKTNLMRELHEELHIQGNTDIEYRVMGLINEDTDPTGRVHLGILVVIDVSSDCEITVRETEELEGFWAISKYLRESPVYDNLEGWSKIALQIL